MSQTRSRHKIRGRHLRSTRSRWHWRRWGHAACCPSSSPKRPQLHPPGLCCRLLVRCCRVLFPLPQLSGKTNPDAQTAAASPVLYWVVAQAEEKNPGVVHELIDAILESEQSKGGEDTIEKLLRVANREIAGAQPPCSAAPWRHNPRSAQPWRHLPLPHSWLCFSPR